MAIELSSEQAAPIDLARMSLLTQREVATHLRVTPRTVRRWDRAGLLRPIRLGGVTRYRADEIAALIGSRTDGS